jgi:hypothetical protein
VPVMMRDVALEAVGPESGLRSIVGTGSVRSRPPLELGDMRPYLSVLTVRQRYELRILRNNPESRSVCDARAILYFTSQASFPVFCYVSDSMGAKLFDGTVPMVRESVESEMYHSRKRDASQAAKEYGPLD